MKMAKGKRVFVIAAVSGGFLVLLAVFLVIMLPKQADTGTILTSTPVAHDPTSSQFGREVHYPNDHEGKKVWSTWLVSYMIGQYSEEYRNYDDVLAKADIAREIAGVIDPSLTEARSKFPGAQVQKDIYNGLMTVGVYQAPDGERGAEQDSGGSEALEESGDYRGGTGVPRPVYGLNFDLHTGQPVDLRSVFADNFDAQTAVDQAVQPYVLAYDEENIRKFKGVDLHQTGFTLDEAGIWLIFDEKSLFLAGKSIYIEWYKFGEGAIAVFDRFGRLEDAEIVSEEREASFEILLYRSEPRYLVAQNTNFYLPTHYENDYERELAEKAKQMVLGDPGLSRGEVPAGGFSFRRLGDYRVVVVAVWDEKERERKEWQGIFHIKEKREITAAEFYGDDYEQQVLAGFHQAIADGDNDSHQTRRALATDQELLDLLKSAEFDPVKESFTFSRKIYVEEYTSGDVVRSNTYDTLYIPSQKEWWR
jgi:hypothetical protein